MRIIYLLEVAMHLIKSKYSSTANKIFHFTSRFLPSARIDRNLAYLILLLPTIGIAQTNFTKITDPENGITQQTGIPVYNGVSWVDYDNDGWEDCFINSNNLYRNLQDGRFEKVDFSSINFGNGNGGTWGDYDGDGDLDVFIAAAPSFLYRNEIDSFVQAPITLAPIDTFNFWSAAWGDYDNDGWLDLVLIHPAGFIPFTNPVSRPSLLLKNNQDGTFSYVDSPIDDELAAHTIGTWTDYDLDGDQDLFIGSGEVNFLSRDHIYINQLAETGQASFLRLEEGALATDLRDGQNWNFIDYDLDGDLDAFITNYRNAKPNDLYKNENGTYILQTASDVGSIAGQNGFGLNNVWADFDNDGYLDCFVVFDSNQKDRYYHNNGDGTFSEIEQVFSISASTRGAAAGDYDNDGFQDLMVSATSSGAVGLYHNEGNDNNWFQLRLQAAAPNTAAIGAKVWLKATIQGAGKWQFREVNAQNTFNGHNSLRVHFGLAEAELIDSLVVTWPDGTEQLATNLTANKNCTWLQGGSIDCSIPSSSSEIKQGNGFLNVFPNPNKSKNQLNVHFQFLERGATFWRLYDTTGRIVHQNSQLVEESRMVETELPIQNLKVGTYILEIQRGANVLTTQFVIIE